MKNNMLSKAFVNMDNQLKMGHNVQDKSSGKLANAPIDVTVNIKNIALQVVYCLEIPHGKNGIHFA